MVAFCSTFCGRCSSARQISWPKSPRKSPSGDFFLRKRIPLLKIEVSPAVEYDAQAQSEKMFGVSAAPRTRSVSKGSIHEDSDFVFLRCCAARIRVVLLG